MAKVICFSVDFPQNFVDLNGYQTDKRCENKSNMS